MEKITSTQIDKYQDDKGAIRYDYSVNSDETGNVTGIDFFATLIKTQLRIASGSADRQNYRFVASTEYGVQNREAIEGTINAALNELLYSKDKTE